MKFTAEKSQIVEALQNAAAVAERRQTIPILANLRLKASSGKLEVTATDLEIQIKNYSEIVAIEEEGETTVSARKMSELCRSLPDAENVDFAFFLDAANVWGVDYDSSLEINNNIKSSIGIGLDWFTLVGPLNFSLALPISKDTSDKTESFRFNLGTTF